MENSVRKTVYTIGHSTRSENEFLAALQSFGIKVLADVRRYPGSLKYPQFNVQNLQQSLAGAGIQYLPFPELGGRRKPKPDSHNTVWKSESFRGYADYSETPEFRDALQKMAKTATDLPTAYMCSEAVWWRCHRAIISDCLKAGGWQVLHIMNAGQAKEHPFTSAYLSTHS